MYINVASSNDASNLSNLLKDGNWMVLYYAEWCGHCKTMKPEWSKVVNKFNNPSNNSNNINLAEIESSHLEHLINKPKIDGYPMIQMYNNGKEVAKFEDERIARKIEEFANNNSIRSSNSRSSYSRSSNSRSSNMTNMPSMTNILPVNLHKEPYRKIVNIKNLLLNVKKFSNPKHTSNNRHSQQSQQSQNLQQVQFPFTRLKPMPLKTHKSHMKMKNLYINTSSNSKVNSSYPCTKINNSKSCNSKPSCYYNYRNNSCDNKFLIGKLNKKTKISTHKTQKHKLHKSHKSHKSQKHQTHKLHKLHKPKKQNKLKHINNNSLMNTPSSSTSSSSNSNNTTTKRPNTKTMFDKLMNSLKLIGNESKKDSKLLYRWTKTPNS